jgi:hypothetical protein
VLPDVNNDDCGGDCGPDCDWRPDGHAIECCVAGGLPKHACRDQHRRSTNTECLEYVVTQMLGYDPIE